MALLSIVGVLLGASISFTQGDKTTFSATYPEGAVYPDIAGTIVWDSYSAIAYVSGLPHSKEPGTIRYNITKLTVDDPEEQCFGMKWGDEEHTSVVWVGNEDITEDSESPNYWKSDTENHPRISIGYMKEIATDASLFNSRYYDAPCPKEIYKLNSVDVLSLVESPLNRVFFYFHGGGGGNIVKPIRSTQYGFRLDTATATSTAKPALGCFFNGWSDGETIVCENPVIHVKHKFPEVYRNSSQSAKYYFAEFSTWSPSEEYPVYHPFKRSPGGGGGGGGHGPRYPIPPQPGNSFVLVSTFADKSEYGSTTPVSDCYAGRPGTSFSVTLTATANDGCEFVKWINSSGGLESSDATFTKTLTYPTTPMAVDYYDATAIFKSNGVCKVDITSNLPDAGSETGAGEHYNLGDQLRLEAFPGNGYWFLYWTMLTPESPELVRDTVFEEDLYFEYEHFGANYRKCTYQPMDKDGSLLCNSSGQIIFDGNGGKLLQ